MLTTAEMKPPNIRILFNFKFIFEIIVDSTTPVCGAEQGLTPLP